MGHSFAETVVYDQQAYYLKNGVRKDLPARNAGDGTIANGITVSNDHVYVVGTQNVNYLYHSIPCLWKDGKLVPFFDNYSLGTLNSVVISDTNVYTCGNVAYTQLSGESNKTIAAYFKNGIPFFLTKRTHPASDALSIFISGADVYVGGFDNYGTHNVACYWKNGVQVTLTNGSTDAVATSIVVDNDKNVWVAGSIVNPDGVQVAVYWKNGARVNLSKYGQNASAASIFLSRS